MADRKRMGERWPAVAGDAALAAVVAVLIAGLALAGAHRSRLLVLERREADDRATLAEVAAGVTGDLERGLAQMGLPAPPVPPGSPGVGRLERGTASISTGIPVEPATALRDPEVRTLLARAQELGEPQIGGPLELADGPRLLLVAATYASPVPPTGSAERRRLLDGWFVAQVDVAALVGAHLPAGAAASARVQRVELPVTAAGTDGLPEQVVDVGGVQVALRAGDADPVPLSAATLGLAAGGVVAGLLGGAAVVAARRRWRERGAELARTSSQVVLIGEVAPVVQQSLDLADVLPAVAVQLSDHFGLAGVRLSSGTTSSGQVELFGIGARPISSTPVLTPPEHLAAGESLTLALQRGGRSVALLQIVAGRPLDRSDLQSLRVITELIGAAVVNASLFASQQEAVRQLRELDGLKTVFLSTASHELRTPATAISGFATLLAGSWDRFDDERRQEFAGRIAANARSLNAVVQDLLDFSLLDRGRLALAVEKLSLGPLVRSVVDRLGPALPDHTVVVEADHPVPVAADANAVERIITNLLTNAAKFSPAGSTITVAAVPVGDAAALVVSDQGPGVPVEEREQVFTRFFRGSGEAVVKTRGVGIGLSVVAELAERMGGTVAIDDAPGGGARFTVRFAPATAVPELQEVQDASTA